MEISKEKLELLKLYSELNFYVFPCYEVSGNVCSCNNGAECGHSGKHPRVQWTKPENCTNDFETMKEWFSGKYYNSNIAVNCGLSKIWVVDVDTKNGALGYESFESLVHEYGIPPQTLQSVTPSGGFHIFFKQSDPQIGTTANAYPGIDLRGNGGYVLLPPSVCPSNNWEDKFDQRQSKLYTLRDSNSNSEESDEIEISYKISFANDNWIKAFEGLTNRSKDVYIDRQKVISEDSIEDSEPNPLLKSWDEFERALSHIPSDCIGLPGQDRRAFITFFKIIGGIADACAGRKGLDLAIRWAAAISLNGRCASNYVSPNRVAYEFYRARNGNDKEKNKNGELVSGYKTVFHIAKACGCNHNMDWWGGQIKQFRRVSMSCVPPKDNFNPDITLTNFKISQPVIEIDVTEDLKFGEEHPPTFPELKLTGAVSYAYNYYNSINPVESPLLSVLPALTTVAAATNRCFKTENLRAVLFAINTCAAGGGKNAGVSGSEAIMETINMEDNILHNPRSASSLYRKLVKTPCTYWIIDEIEQKLKPMFDQRSGTHFKEIVPLILSSYSCGGGRLGGLTFSDEENNLEAVINPTLNIFGTMPSESIQDLIKKDQILSGFVRRFLIAWSPAGKRKKGRNAVSANHQDLNRLSEWKSQLIREFSLGDIADLKGNHKDISFEIQDYNFYENLVKEKDFIISKIPDVYKGIWSGWEENVKRVALILAAGERALYPNRNLILNEHLDTASKIVTTSCNTWVFNFRHNISDGEIDKYAKQLVKELNHNKKDGVRLPDFRERKKLQKKFLMDDVVNMLIENGGVFMAEIPTKSANGRRLMTPFLWNINYLPEKIKQQYINQFEDEEENNNKIINIEDAKKTNK